MNSTQRYYANYMAAKIVVDKRREELNNHLAAPSIAKFWMEEYGMPRMPPESIRAVVMNASDEQLKFMIDAVNKGLEAADGKTA